MVLSLVETAANSEHRTLDIMKNILLLFFFVAVCSAGCGIFTAPSGNVYNLDPLTKTTDYNGAEFGTTNLYFYNYCQFVNRTNCGAPAYAVQINYASICVPIGIAYPTISELSPQNGVQLVTVNNNDLCGNPRTIPRVSTFTITCNPNVEYNLTSITEPGVCQYYFAAQSKYACPTAAPPPSNKTDCCIPSGVSGCAEPTIESCVCKRDATCCTGNWTQACVNKIKEYGCGDCNLGRCCLAHRGKGCEDRAVSTCVCNQRESCCTQAWDRECVNAVINNNCGYCAGICCTEGPSCSDNEVRDCVCRMWNI